MSQLAPSPHSTMQSSVFAQFTVHAEPPLHSTKQRSTSVQ
jgi:hypothetical protein